MEGNEDYYNRYLAELRSVIELTDYNEIEAVIAILKGTKCNNGRLFILGVGGSAANASHAVNDFRKIAGIEAYAPTDNVAELTARTNDDGWETVFSEWLKLNRLTVNDTILVLSVGGGDEEKNISVNIINAFHYVRMKTSSTIIGIVGKSTGFIAKNADVRIIMPAVSPDLVTPLSESYQAIIWHLIATSPGLKTT